MIGSIAMRSTEIGNMRLQQQAAATITRKQAEMAEAKPKLDPAQTFLKDRLADITSKGGKAQGAVGDFNGDGKKDVMIVTDSGLMQIYSMDEDGKFSLSASTTTNFHGIEGLDVVDKNGDGVPDKVVMKRGDLEIDVVYDSNKKSWGVDETKYKIFAADIDGDKTEDEVIVDIKNNRVLVTTFDDKGKGDTRAIGIEGLGEINLQLVDADGDGTMELQVIDNTKINREVEKKGDTVYEREVREFDKKIYNLLGGGNALRSNEHKKVLNYVKATGPRGSYSIQF